MPPNEHELLNSSSLGWLRANPCSMPNSFGWPSSKPVATLLRSFPLLDADATRRGERKTTIRRNFPRTIISPNCANRATRNPCLRPKIRPVREGHRRIHAAFPSPPIASESSEVSKKKGAISPPVPRTRGSAKVRKSTEKKKLDHRDIILKNTGTRMFLRRRRKKGARSHITALAQTRKERRSIIRVKNDLAACLFLRRTKNDVALSHVLSKGGAPQHLPPHLAISKTENARNYRAKWPNH